jgi:hypothetical protein
MRSRLEPVKAVDSGHEHEGVAVNAVYFRSNGRSLVVENRHVCPTTDLLNEVDKLLTEVASQLERSEEALHHHRVVVAVAGSAHAALHVVLLQDRPIGGARVLAAPDPNDA